MVKSTELLRYLGLLPKNLTVSKSPIHWRRAVAAQDLGVFERYVDENYRHMWSEPKNLDDPMVWRAALLESGFDAGRFEELVQDPAVKARLLENTQSSVMRGTFGSPTFFVGDEIFFGKDRLRDVEEMILATR